MIRIFFCYNQVSYLIARDCCIKYKNVVIILFKSRVTKKTDINCLQFYYNKYLSLTILILSIISDKIEVIIPHTNGGKVLKLISKFSKKLSYIDDGMDTFREIPKNIEISIIKKNTKYYSFNYKIPVAKWLNNFEIIEISDILSLGDNNNRRINLNLYENLIIESNGICFDFIDKSNESIFLIKHPSAIKNKKYEINFKSSFCDNIEGSLLDYNGKIIIGETMVLIFLLHTNIDLSKIILHLNKTDYNNLSCLKAIFDKCFKVHLH